jgi:hypothetical protein
MPELHTESEPNSKPAPNSEPEPESKPEPNSKYQAETDGTSKSSLQGTVKLGLCAFVYGAD